jgi:hypothetical protein
MKKTLTLLAVVAAVVITTGICFAAKEKASNGEKADKKPSVERTSQADALRQKMQQRRKNMPTDPQERMRRFKERYDKELKLATEGPLATISELIAIKKIAKKEKAKKTIVAIDHLIANTKKHMEKKVQAIEDRQAKFKELLEKRGKGPGKNAGKRPVRQGRKKKPAKDAPKDTEAPADKK